MTKKGLFITLEGIEGAGKSTQAEFVRDTLQEAGHEAVLTREPGGTVTGEAIRTILLEGRHLTIDDTTELLLIFSARAQHLQEVIRPALSRGNIVVCDRFTDATYAYQGGGRGIPRDRIAVLEEYVQAGLKPDLTLLFDVTVSTGLARAGNRGEADRFESETARFFERVRSAYLAIADAEAGRVRVIDAEKSLQDVQESLRTLLKEQQLC